MMNIPFQNKHLKQSRLWRNMSLKPPGDKYFGECGKLLFLSVLYKEVKILSKYFIDKNQTSNIRKEQIFFFIISFI